MGHVTNKRRRKLYALLAKKPGSAKKSGSAKKPDSKKTAPDALPDNAATPQEEVNGEE